MMLIARLQFATIVSGVAEFGLNGASGRIALR
jgi:hypothetical protein